MGDNFWDHLPEGGLRPSSPLLFVLGPRPMGSGEQDPEAGMGSWLSQQRSGDHRALAMLLG